MIRKGLKMKKKHLRSRTWDKIRSHILLPEGNVGRQHLEHIDVANESSLMVIGK